jgi:hypothetical protein
MPYQGNLTIAYLIANLISAAIYAVLAIRKYGAEGFDPSMITSDWGTLILIVIVVQVVLSILASIIVTVIQAGIARAEPDTRSDERDKLFELRGSKVSYAVFGSGFSIAMLTLALGLPALVMFNVLILSLFVAGITGNVVQIVLYRRGY